MASKSASTDTNVFRFFDGADEPFRRLAPLRGYENLKLVSLQKATDPLVPIAHEIKHMVHNALADSKQIQSPLPLDQCASIVLYSMQWTPRESSFYHILNRTLRSPSRDKILAPWLLFLKLFLTALAGLPSTGQRTVYRGVKLDLLEKYPIKSTTVWWGFSSCTNTITTLQNEDFCGQSGTKTLFLIETDTGKDIHKFSSFPDETEILLLLGRKLEVIGHLKMADGASVIQMKEIQTSFPHIASLPPNHVKLTYANRWLTETDLEHVMKEALVEKNCTELDLSSNRISRKGAAIIANALRDNKIIRCYFLHNTVPIERGPIAPKNTLSPSNLFSGEKCSRHITNGYTA